MRPWIVKQHDELQKLEPELWAVESDIRAGGLIRRRMGIIRLPDGRIAFLNAVPLRDEAMREIEAWGTPARGVESPGRRRVGWLSLLRSHPGHGHARNA